MEPSLLVIIVTCLLGISEGLALTKFKSNSIFQVIVTILKALAPKKSE